MRKTEISKLEQNIETAVVLTIILCGSYTGINESLNVCHRFRRQADPFFLICLYFCYTMIVTQLFCPYDLVCWNAQINYKCLKKWQMKCKTTNWIPTVLVNSVVPDVELVCPCSNYYDIRHCILSYKFNGLIQTAILTCITK